MRILAQGEQASPRAVKVGAAASGWRRGCGRRRPHLQRAQAPGSASGPSCDRSAMQVELSCERNLFFHYTHLVTASSFKRVQESQRLMVELGDYPAVLARNLMGCVREPSTFLAVLVVQLDGSARLDFVQASGAGGGRLAGSPGSCKRGMGVLMNAAPLAATSRQPASPPPLTVWPTHTHTPRRAEHGVQVHRPAELQLRGV